MIDSTEEYEEYEEEQETSVNSYDEDILSLLQNINSNIETLNERLTTLEDHSNVSTLTYDDSAIVNQLEGISNGISVNTASIGFIFGLLVVSFLFRRSQHK